MSTKGVPKLRSFERRTLIGACAIFLSGVVVGGIACYRQEVHSASDTAQSFLGIGFCLAVVAFMGFIVFRTVFSVPRCPHCREKMRETGQQTVNGGKWRRFRCDLCGEEWRVSGLSS